MNKFIILYEIQRSIFLNYYGRNLKYKLCLGCSFKLIYDFMWKFLQTTNENQSWTINHWSTIFLSSQIILSSPYDQFLNNTAQYHSWRFHDNPIGFICIYFQIKYALYKVMSKFFNIYCNNFTASLDSYVHSLILKIEELISRSSLLFMMEYFICENTTTNFYF